MTARPISQMIVRLGGSGPGSDPDPATFCPANGYIIDPSLYVPDPEIITIPRPSTEKIRLVVTDQGSRHIQGRCSISLSGTYYVRLIGLGDVQISQSTVNNNITFTLMVPTSGGFPGSGYSYFYVDLVPVLETNSIIGFSATVNTAYDPLGGYITAAFFYTPNITSIASGFSAMKRIKHIEILSTTNSLTTLNNFCASASSLQKLVLPSSMPVLTDMTGMCSGTALADLTFPDNLPALMNMASTFAGTKIKTFTFYASMLALVNLSSTFSGSSIETVYFEMASLSEVNTIASMFLNCSKLRGNITYPNLPKVTNISNAHEQNSSIEEIVFTGNMDLLTLLTKTASFCTKLKKFVFPESVLGLITLYNLNNTLEGCSNLEELVLPKVWKPTDNTGTSFFNGFVGNNKLTTFGKVEDTNNVRFGSLNIANLYSLKRWDQPKLNFSGLQLAAQTGVQGQLEYFEMNWGYFAHTSLVFTNQNLDWTEVRRILASIVTTGSFNPFSVSGNPRCMSNVIIGNCNSAGSYVQRWLKASWQSGISIGMCVSAQQGNKSTNNFTYKGGDVFGLDPSFWNVSPHNGVRMMYQGGALEAYGLVKYQVYYVVESLNGGGVGYKLSLTPGGTPISLGAAPAKTGVNFVADCYVENIIDTGTYMDVYLSFPVMVNSGSRTAWYMDPAIFDFWEMNVKGYIPY